MWRSTGSLLLVVGLILVAARFWKKHGPKGTAVLPSEAVEVLGRRALDQRQSIHLVRLGTRILVLGSTANGLTTLTEVTDPVEVDYLAGLCNSRDEVDGSVSQTFRALFQKHGTAEVAPLSAASASPTSREAEELAERIRLQTTAPSPSSSGMESLHA